MKMLFIFYCRTSFKFTKDDLNQRKLLDLKYNNWQPPSQINNYIPDDLLNNQNIRRNRRRSNTVSFPILPQVQNINFSEEPAPVLVEPFSRVRKNMVRNRRRNLDFDDERFKYLSFYLYSILK